MLSALSIHNYKSHQRTDLALGNLTLLAGSNSSGKSSILQSLLLLRQSFLANKLGEGLELNGPLCKPGIGQDVLCRFATSGVISFDLTDVALFRYRFDANEKRIGTTFMARLPDETSSGANNDAERRLSLFGKDFQYVSSARLGGQSHFDGYDYEVGELRQVSKLLGQGECVAHFLDRYCAEKTTNYLFDGNDYELADQVELWERKISAGLTVTVKKSPLGGYDVFYGYEFKGQKPVADLRAENIGYGISSSLPVIVALVAAKPGSLILLENPEAHLHPKGQAELAKLIARVAQAGVQVIVETHSDHILNGVLLATRSFESENPEDRRKGLDRNKVRLYWIDHGESSMLSAVSEVKVEAHGRLDYQPHGFFDQMELDQYRLFGIGTDDYA